MVKAQLLVTRPEYAQASSVRCFELAGYACTSLPLICIEPLNIETHAAGTVRTQFLNLDHYNKVIFISPNAARIGGGLIDQLWPQLPIDIDWLAIGQGTAQALTKAGIDARVNMGIDSEAMLDDSQLQELNQQRILIVKGIGGRPLLQQQLEQRGAKVELAEVYKRTACKYDSHRLKSELNQKPDAILITSGEALEILQTTPLPFAKNDMLLVVPSARIARMAKSLGFSQVVTSNGASDSAMLNCLNTVFKSCLRKETE